MPVYTFGSKYGEVSKRKATKIERVTKHIRKSMGTYVEFVTYRDFGCNCGHGCARNCPEKARAWFECMNLGFPHNAEVEREVYAELKAAGIEW